MTIPTVTDDLLKDIEEAARAATPGPWSREPDSGLPILVRETVFGRGIDADFIAKANPSTVLALIAHIRELDAREVVLPNMEGFSRYETGTARAMRDCCAESIEAAGVRVKG